MYDALVGLLGEWAKECIYVFICIYVYIYEIHDVYTILYCAILSR